jgi:hypothetical protein
MRNASGNYGYRSRADALRFPTIDLDNAGSVGARNYDGLSGAVRSRAAVRCGMRKIPNISDQHSTRNRAPERVRNQRLREHSKTLTGKPVSKKHSSP